MNLLEVLGNVVEVWLFVAAVVAIGWVAGCEFTQRAAEKREAAYRAAVRDLDARARRRRRPYDHEAVGL